MTDDVAFGRLANAMLGELKASHLYLSPPVANGAKGGVGATTVAVNVATTLAKAAPGVSVECVSYKDYRPEEKFDAAISIVAQPMIATMNIAVGA